MPTTFGGLNINHELFLTMFDGKVANQMTGTSSKMCPCCGAIGHALNFPGTMNPDLIQNGLSTLHGLLRGLDFYLALAYGVDEPEERKKVIQDQFKDQLNLLIDIPLSGGGTSNNGNTARKFFREHAITSEITDVPEELIERYHTIISVLCGSKLLDPVKLREYNTETANLLRTTYPNKNFTPTIHKILYHSPEVVEYFNQFNIPVGMMSEEPLEASHKNIRNNRYDFARKMNKTVNEIDVYGRLIMTSDPEVNSHRIQSKAKNKSYTPAMTALFLNRPEVLMDIDNN